MKKAKVIVLFVATFGLLFLLAGCSLDLENSQTQTAGNSARTGNPPQLNYGYSYYFIRNRWAPYGKTEYLRIRTNHYQRNFLECEPCTSDPYTDNYRDYFLWMIYEYEPGKYVLQNKATQKFIFETGEWMWHMPSNTWWHSIGMVTPATFSANEFCWSLEATGEGWSRIKSVETGFFLSTELHNYSGYLDAVDLSNNPLAGSEWWSTQWAFDFAE